MEMREYHKLAMRTSPRDGHDKIDNGILGLIGETGELIDIYKKWVYQSHPGAELPKDRLADELGDVIWYLAEIADGMEKNLRDIICADFDRLDQSARKLKVALPLRKTIMHMMDDALLIEKTCSEEKMRVYMHLIMEHAAQLAKQIGMPMAEIAQRNIDKLKKRYPDGFDARISEARYE